MARITLFLFCALAMAMALAATAPPAASSDNAGVAPDCPPLAREEAASVLSGMVDNVAGVVPGPLPGFWEVDVSMGGKVYPLYMDCARKFVFQGQFLRLADKQNVTGLRYADLNRVDVSAIPLKDAILVGNRSSKRKVIVLSDPTCPYCVKLHAEIKKAAASDPGAAFYVMPYPRNANDQATYRKCLAVVCAKSVKALDDAFTGKQLPEPSCKSDAVKETVRLAQRLQIQGTPAMILPDGRIVSGYMDAEALLALTR